METVINFFKKVWNIYRNWLGDKVWYKNWKVWLSVFVVLAIAGIGETDESEAESEEPETEEVTHEEIQEEQEKKEQEKKEREEAEKQQIKQEAKEKEEQEEEPEPELTTEEKIEEAAKEVFGDNLNEFEYQSDSNHYNITTETAGLSKNMDKNSANVNTTEFLEKIEGEDFSTIYIEYQAEFVDDYGETSKDRAIVYDISKETVEKINFENFIIDKMPDVADNYWEHPALR